MKILIADDQRVVREGLKQILADAFSPIKIEETDNAETLISKACSDDWDLVISDLAMPGGGGLRALETILEERHSMKILILSTYPEEQYAIPVIRVGAAGYLNKNYTSSELLHAVKEILDGRTYIPDAVAGEIAAHLHELLNERELPIFKLLAKGKSIPEISQELSMDSDEVTIHRRCILAKMNRNDESGLADYARQNQLI